MVTRAKTFILSTTALAASVAAMPAFAQNVGESFARDRNVSVRSRPRPDYEAIGARVGSFMLLPRLTTTLTNDNNVRATGSNELSDTIGTVVGEANLQSNWNNNALSGFAQVRRDAYQDLSSESVTTYGLGGAGQLDVTRDTAFIGGASWRRLAEPRTGSGAPPTDRPVRYDLASVYVGGAHAFNRLRVTGRYNLDDFDFKSGRLGSVVISQDYRDKVQHNASAKLDYAVSPATAFFVEAEYDKRSYRNSAAAVIDRDSNGYQLTAGADFDLTNLAQGKVQVGYIHQSFDAPTVPDVKGLGGRAEVALFPSQLTTVTLRASRSINDTGLLASPGLSASAVGAQVDHELLRNLILTARYDYQEDDYQGVDRKDERTSFSLGGLYLLNRRVGLNILYNHIEQDSSGAAQGANYGIDRVSGSLVLQF